MNFPNIFHRQLSVVTEKSKSFIDNEVKIHDKNCGGKWVCCATTSMQKIEIELEPNFLSGSVSHSRLVRLMISVPFVV